MTIQPDIYVERIPVKVDFVKKNMQRVIASRSLRSLQITDTRSTNWYKLSI